MKNDDDVFFPASLRNQFFAAASSSISLGDSSWTVKNFTGGTKYGQELDFLAYICYTAYVR
jgi:hypothetical protein